MKFTSKDLMKAMGLQVGDTIKFETDIWELMFDEKHNLYMFVLLRDKSHCFAPTYLVDHEYEVLPRPKRVGETLCKGKCETCPLRITRCEYKHDGNETLYDILDCAFDGIEDQEIHDLIKARLDKEVE